MSTAIKTSVFSFLGTLYDLFIFHRHRICLVDRVDLICCLYNWWEGFWVFFLSHTAPGFNCGFIYLFFFNCGFIPPLHVGHPLGFAPEAALEDLGVEVLQLLGLQGFWQHQVLREVGS